jgi:hypothetical protein
MCTGAIKTLIAKGDDGGDELPFQLGERAIPAEKDLGELPDGRAGIGAVFEETGDTRQTVVQLYICHDN